MAQEYEKIIDILQELRKISDTNSDNFNRLLYDVSLKLDSGGKNISPELIGAYINEITRSLEEKYNVTMTKFQDIEHALRAVYNNQSNNITGSDLKNLFDTITQNINNFYSEARQQKAILAGVETKLSDLITNKSDKNDIMRTISLLRNDFENINHAYKYTIDDINTNLKSIISNLITIDPLKNGENTRIQVDIMYHAVNDIVNKLQYLEEKSENLEKILNNVATNEDLKTTQSIVDAIITKTEEIEEIVTENATKEDIENIKETLKELNDNSADNAKSEEVSEILSKTKNLLSQTDEVKQTLGKVALDIEKIPQSSELENSMKNLYSKIDDLAITVETALRNNEMIDIGGKLAELKDEFEIIKNIINDLNEALSTKILNAIDNISFESDMQDLKNSIKDMLNRIPQTDDIELLDKKHSNIFQSIIEKTDSISDKIDNFSKLEENLLDEISEKVDLIPEYKKNFDDITETQNTISGKLDEISSFKNNFDGLTEEHAAISDKIDGFSGIEDSLNKIAEEQRNISSKISDVDFDKEFTSIYDKTSSIESWLIESNIKENSEKIASQMQNTTTLADLEELNNRTNQIVDALEALSKSEDVSHISENLYEIDKNVNEVISLLKNSSIHDENLEISDKLTDLERSVSQIVSRNEFNDFIEDLKYCITKLSTSTGSCSENIEQMLKLRNELEDKLNSFDFSQVLRVLNGKFDKLQECISQDLIQNVKQEIKDGFDDNNLALTDIRNSVEIVADMNEKLNSTQQNLSVIDEFIRSNLPVDNDFIKSEISDIKNILLNDFEKLSQDEDVQNSNNKDLEKIKEYLENIKSFVEEESNSDILIRVSSIEDMLNANQTFNDSAISKIIDSINSLENNLDKITEDNTQISEAIEELKYISEGILKISDNLKNNTDEVMPDIEQPYLYKLDKIEDFLKDKFSSLKTSIDNISIPVDIQDVNNDFTYQSAVSEGKIDSLIELIEDLKQKFNSEEVKDKYRNAADELTGFKQELEFITTDITENLNSKISDLSKELNEIKQLIKETKPSGISNITKQLNNLHNDLVSDEISPQNTLIFEQLYSEFNEKIQISEDNIKDCVLNDTDTIITKIENLKEYIENLLPTKNITNADDIGELQEFKNDITEFKFVLENALKNSTDSIINFISEQNNEIKSLITITNNHDKILEEINNLKLYFKNIQPNEDFEITDFEEESTENKEIDASEFIDMYPKEKSSDEVVELPSYYHKDPIKDIPAYEEICKRFDEYSQKIEELSGKNNVISEILNSISQKLEENFNKNSSNLTSETDINITENNAPFDFVGAFEVLQQDITELKNTVEGIKNFEDADDYVLNSDEDFGCEDETELSENDNETKSNANNFTKVLSRKIDEILHKLNENWADNIKHYIALRNDDITSRLDSISSKLDIFVSDTTASDMISEMSDTIYGIDEKLSDLDESDKQLTSMLEELSKRIAEIALGTDTNEDIADIKNLIAEQRTFIETLEPSEKLDAFKKCLEELTTEVSNLASGTEIGNESIQKSVKDMKESIMSAVVNIFGQVSFAEESEDIKDFVEERTDEINKNIEQITKQIQQISSGVPSDYNYSLQDVETDIAKLRLALNELKPDKNSQITPEEISVINEKLHSISLLVDSFAQDEMKELKSEITTLKEQTQFLIATSDKSYNALNNGIVGFEEIINDSLTGKVDRVTKMLEKSADSDNVIKQALIYMGEWIDSADENINKISSKSEEISNKFDLLNTNLQKLEHKLANVESLEEQLSMQQDRIDRLEMNIDKLLSIVENMDDSTSIRKIDKIEKQLSKLGTNIEKLTSYVE